MRINRDDLAVLLSPYYNGIFLLLDGIISIDEEKKEIIAYKYIGKRDPFLKRHLKGKVYPGFVLAECIAQAFITMILKTSEKKLKGEPRLVKVSNITFGKEIKMGNQLRIVVQMISTKKRVFSFRGYVEDYLTGKKALEIDCIEGRFLSNGLIERMKTFFHELA